MDKQNLDSNNSPPNAHDAWVRAGSQVPALEPKRCHDCGEWKAISVHFRKNCNSCKACRSAYQKSRRTMKYPASRERWGRYKMGYRGSKHGSGDWAMI